MYVHIDVLMYRERERERDFSLNILFKAQQAKMAQRKHFGAQGSLAAACWRNFHESAPLPSGRRAKNLQGDIGYLSM